VSASAHDSCIAPAVLGAVLDGTLPRERVASVTHHLSRCAKCRSLLERAAEVEQELDVEPRRGPWLQWLAVAAVLAGAFVLVPLFFSKEQPPPADPIASLIAASPQSARTLEPRLSGGFRWAPLRSPRRSPGDQKTQEQLVASGEAAKVLREIGNDRSARALHAAGVAYLVAGDPDAAVPLLTEASRVASGDARVWSDLSAALYASMKQDDRTALGQALNAANRAIHLSPGMPEPYFNRALIVERIGSPSEAMAAWNEYLQRDRAGEWSTEARRRLANIPGA
jgi:tetratricopeptide (TPR) repeat protein